MAGMNALIHLVASLALIGLCWQWLKALKQRNFLRQMLGDSGHRKIFVDWPESLIKKTADSLGVPMEGGWGGDTGKPVKIEMSVWADFLANQYVDRFILKHDHQKTLVIMIRGKRTGGDMSPEALERALSVSVELVSTVESSS